MNNTKSKIYLIISMLIFGTIGIFRRYLPFPSAFIACTRGFIGSVFILFSIILTKNKLRINMLKSKLPLLCISGGCIGVNWILLFEAYRYTTVATATLCYYMAPIFIITASPFLLGEKLTVKKTTCIFCAFIGMFLVSGVLNSDFSVSEEFFGVILGLLAAVFYASVIIMNKKITGIPAKERTMVQLFSAAVVVLPYSLFAENIAEVSITPISIVMLIIIGVIHTGIAYVLYFGSLDGIRAQTAAVLSYIDPIFAIILSALLLREKIGAAEIIGAILVLGSTLISELSDSKSKT